MGAYIIKPNYVNAMSAGLNARLGYDNSSRSSSGGGGGSGVGMGGIGSSRVNNGGATTGLDNEMKRAQVSKAWADVVNTKANTADTNKMTSQADAKLAMDQEASRSSNKVNDANIKKAEAERLKNVVDIVGNFATNATQESMADLFDWAAEESGIDRSAWASAETIADMTPTEFKVFQSKMVAGKDYMKNLKDATKAQTLADEKKVTAANKEITDVHDAIYKIKTSANLMDLFAKSPQLSAALTGMGVNPQDTNAKERILEYYEGRLDELNLIVGKTREQKAPAVKDKKLGKAEAQQFMKEAGGDKAKAIELAKKAGYTG